MTTAEPSLVIVHAEAFTIQSVGGTAYEIPVRAKLEWARTAAVEVRITLGHVPWLMSRDLLIDGLGAPTGDGDVRVSPRAPNQVELLLYPQAARQPVVLHEHTVRGFLRRTTDLVPLGREHIDFSLIEAWCRG